MIYLASCIIVICAVIWIGSHVVAFVVSNLDSVMKAMGWGFVGVIGLVIISLAASDDGSTSSHTRSQIEQPRTWGDLTLAEKELMNEATARIARSGATTQRNLTDAEIDEIIDAMERGEKIE